MTDELKKEFEEILNKRFEYTRYSDQETFLEAMHLAYQMGEKKRSEDVVSIIRIEINKIIPENESECLDSSDVHQVSILSGLLTKINELK